MTAVRTEAGEFLRLVGDGDEYAAIELVLGLLDDGVPPQRVLIDLIGRTQAEVGRLWAENRWSVAREHAATSVSERAVAALSARFPVRPVRGRVTIACVDGEWHALPVRILAEVLRLDGWRTDFLGANVPGQHLVTHLHETGPDAVALSCMLPARLPRAHAAITATRATGVPVIAGGPGFGPGGRYAQRLGADAWAATAEDAATRLRTHWPPAAAHESPRLGDDEYTYVVRHRPTLIGTAMSRLTDSYPGVRAYDQRQLDATADDLGHIVDFLAASLYVGEPQIFTGFVTWTAAVLRARGVPPPALLAGLTALHDQLHDYPTARATLQAARTSVRP